MGRPKGSKNKGTLENEVEQKTETIGGATVVIEEPVKEAPKVEEVKKEEAKKEKKAKVELPPLGPGLAYFEAPDGTVITGEDSRNEIWYRAGNNGKGMWINKRR